MSNAKRDPKIENVHAQRWVKSKIQPIMDKLDSGEWLKSQPLQSYFAKVAYDHYTQSIVLILCTVVAIWLLLRHGRVAHPGSFPIRIGHIVLLGAFSSGGKNAAVVLIEKGIRAAYDLFTADVFEHQLGQTENANDVNVNDVNENKEDAGEDIDEEEAERMERKKKAAAMRFKVYDDNDDKVWVIDWEKEKKVRALNYFQFYGY